jgi:hypothetical protein
MDNTQAIIRKFETMVADLSERELVILNNLIVERLRLMHKANSLLHMTST